MTTSIPINTSGIWCGIPWIITNDHTLILNPDKQPVQFTASDSWIPLSSSLLNKDTIYSIIVNENIDTSELKTCCRMFFDMSQLEFADLRKLDTTNVTNMDSMFAFCTHLHTVLLPEKPGCMNNITISRDMFFHCAQLSDLNLHNFSPRAIQNMRSMFSQCIDLPAINLANVNFDTNSENDISYLFHFCESLTHLQLFSGPINTENVSYLFNHCISLTSLDLSSITLTTNKPLCCHSIFFGCHSLSHISFFSNSSKPGIIETSFGMFRYCNQLSSLNMQETVFQDLSFYDLPLMGKSDYLWKYFIDSHCLPQSENLFIEFVKYNKVHLIPYLVKRTIDTFPDDQTLLRQSVQPFFEWMTHNNSIHPLTASDIALICSSLNQL